MSALAWLPRLRAPKLTEEQQERRAALPPAQPFDDTPLHDSRLVVLDLETSGLNVHRDLILSIGAVAIEQGAIHLGEQFERTVFRPNHQVTETVLIHGISPSAIEQGGAAATTLLDFMEFAGECIFLAYHAPFDHRMLSRGLRLDLGHKLRHKFVDIAELAPMVCPDAELNRASLDDWAAYFGLNNSQRHNAAADAMITAEITLILLSKARAQGIVTLADMHSRLGHWRHLRQARSGGI